MGLSHEESPNTAVRGAGGGTLAGRQERLAPLLHVILAFESCPERRWAQGNRAEAAACEGALGGGRGGTEGDVGHMLLQGW